MKINFRNFHTDVLLPYILITYENCRLVVRKRKLKFIFINVITYITNNSVKYWYFSICTFHKFFKFIFRNKVWRQSTEESFVLSNKTFEVKCTRFQIILMEYCKADSSYDVTMKLDLTQMTSFDFFFLHPNTFFKRFQKIKKALIKEDSKKNALHPTRRED